MTSARKRKAQRAAAVKNGTRMKSGVVKIGNGWHVVVELDGEKNVYDPPHATEQEAEATCAALVANMKAAMAEAGISSEPYKGQDQ